jgi:hypothetical protein
MNETDSATEEPRKSAYYAIRIKGHLDHRWSDWFDGMTLTLEDNGDTLLTGPVTDQAALHGLLRKVRDLGLPLLSVIQVTPTPDSGQNDEPDTQPNP